MKEKFYPNMAELQALADDLAITSRRGQAEYLYMLLGKPIEELPGMAANEEWLFNATDEEKNQAAHQIIGYLEARIGEAAKARLHLMMMNDGKMPTDDEVLDRMERNLVLWKQKCRTFKERADRLKRMWRIAKILTTISMLASVSAIVLTLIRVISL